MFSFHHFNVITSICCLNTFIYTLRICLYVRVILVWVHLITCHLKGFITAVNLTTQATSLFAICYSLDWFKSLRSYLLCVRIYCRSCGDPNWRLGDLNLSVHFVFPQLQREDSGAVSDTPGPSRWAFGSGCFLDRVRHKTQGSLASQGGGARLKLDPVLLPGRHRLFGRHSPDRCVADTQVLLVLHPQVFEKRDCKEEEEGVVFF